MAKIILPKTHIDEDEISTPLIFLAGPIKGAPQWHEEAIDILSAHHPELIIATPRVPHTLGSHNIIQSNNPQFERQRIRENYYLEIAAKIGCILFWLPGEINHSCKKSYGAMTRIELGEWLVHYHYNNHLRLSLGTDGAFSEMKTIQVDIDKYAPNTTIHATLNKTCQHAIQQALSR